MDMAGYYTTGPGVPTIPKSWHCIDLADAVGVLRDWFLTTSA
jgi:hypothetical protein